MNQLILNTIPTLTINGIVPGSRYAVLERDTNRVLANEIAEQEEVKIQLDVGPVIVRVRNMDYIPIEAHCDIKNDTRLRVFQTLDRTFPPDTPTRVRQPSVIETLFRKAIQKLTDPDLDLKGIE